MNILIYTTSDFPYGGAAENLVREMALGLHFHQGKIKVIRIKGRMKSDKNDTIILCTDLITSQRPSNELIKGLLLVLTIITIPFSVFINKIFKKSDIILLYGIDYPYLTLPFVFSSKVLKIKIYRIITDYYDFKTIVPVWWKQPKKWFYDRQIKLIDNYFNGLIVLSIFLKRMAIKNGVKNNKIILIPHFINFRLFSNNDRKKYNEFTNRTICFCGSPSIPNGILDLVEAFKILKETHKNLKLLIIGAVNKMIQEEINLICTEINSDDIIFTGFLNRTDVLNHLASCDILINPRKSGSRAEAGFPTKLGEYFATKKPVVSTNTGDIGNYCKNGQELLIVKPDSPQSIADAISSLINNETWANEIGLRGYNWAFQNLDANENAKKLIEYFS